MSPPVTWYRITKLVVGLGLGIAKYVSGSANVGKVDLVFVITSGGVLYFISWWEKHPRFQWYFEPDWPAQGRVAISPVAKLKDLVSKYASEIICALVLISQLPYTLLILGIYDLREISTTIVLLMIVGMAVPLSFPLVWTVFKRHPLTRFERIFLTTTAVLWLYTFFWSCGIRLFVDGSIHKLTALWAIALLTALCASLLACSFAASAMLGRVWPRII